MRHEPPAPGKKGQRRFCGRVAPRVGIEDEVVESRGPGRVPLPRAGEPFLVQDLQ